MRPEVLAEYLGSTIRGVVAPLLQDIQALKTQVAALEARDARRQAAIAELQADNAALRADAKSLGELVLATNYRRPTLSDLDTGDTTH
jgi:hypothetical protein